MHAPPTTSTWIEILQVAYRILDDIEERGLGRPIFSLGGGTVLMLRYKHRLSIDIDLFGYDAQWLSLLTPRLSEFTATLAIDYVEQANAVKIIMARGDIDFVIAGDITRSPLRTTVALAGREIAMDPPSEILAKKMFYRASTFKARDVYDLATAIDLSPDIAREAVQAAAPKATILLQRLATLAAVPEDVMLADITSYDGQFAHSDGMIEKVVAFVEAEGWVRG